MPETWKERRAKGFKKAEWKVLPTRELVEGTPLDPKLQQEAKASE